MRVMFSSAAQQLAQYYREVGFVRMYGNASEAAKHLFKDRLKARVTPTFYFFRNGARADSVCNYVCHLSKPVGE
jgi:hypothetical protein